MALTSLAYLQANSSALLPHIEEMAIQYINQMYVMPSRVRVMGDMRGYNARKISEYALPRRAENIAEDTAIPDAVLLRSRLSSIEPIEVGDRYRISERRAATDPQNILADAVRALGKSVGDRVEADLFTEAIETFRGGTTGSASVDLSLATMNSVVTMALQDRAGDANLFHVMHPYQLNPILSDLLTISGAESGLAALSNANSAAVRQVTLPLIGNVAVGRLTPRRVVIKLAVYGTGGTFRLQVGSGQTVGVNITAAITVSGTPATTVANVKAALEALTFTGNGTWTVTGTANNDITVTPPATLYLDDISQLRPAIKYDEAVTQTGGAFDRNFEKTGYDLVTGVSGGITDRNGVALGFAIFEKSASAYALTFYRDALIYDIRKPITSFSELTMQGRTFEFSISHAYGIGRWQDYLGYLTLTTADSPRAVG